VAIYQGWWNKHVSPGEAAKLAEQMLAEGPVPQATLRQKEVFP